MRKYLLFLLCFSSILSSSYAATTHTEKVRTPKKHDYYNFFNSEVFDSYMLQLRKFTQDEVEQLPLITHFPLPLISSFSSKTLELIAAIQQPYTPEERPTVHEKIITLLRSLIKEKETVQSDNNALTQQSIQFIDSLSVWIYTKPHLLPDFATFLHSVIPDFFTSFTFKEGHLQDHIQQAHNMISARKADLFTGEYHRYPTFNDPLFEGRLPTTAYNAFSTQFIYIPRMNITDEDKSITLVPEFLNYLSVLREQGKKHLYINLMSRLSSERPLCLSLDQLENLFPNVIYVANFDRNSEFYKQSDKHANLDDAERFKRHFMKHLFNRYPEDAAYKWPKQLDIYQWRDNCDAILENVHSKYFESKEKLSAEERRAFIEIVSVKLVEALCNTLNPDFANISCKYSKDRAPLLNSLTYLYSVSVGIQNQGFTQEHSLKVLSFVLATPLLVSNRPAYDSIVDELLLVVPYLEAMQ